MALGFSLCCCKDH